ncbi:MAG: MOSC domain-containing protein [Nocardioidaceae bacterium]
MSVASPTVVAVSSSPRHSFSKQARPAITLVAGVGVDGDSHSGATVQHRSRVRRDPTQPNLRQVHLLAAELHEELRLSGFDLVPGDIGENVTTRGVDLLGLGRGSLLHLGCDAVVAVMGLRNPCRQLDRFRPGLMLATLGRDDAGSVLRRAGVMGVVVHGGVIAVGDPVRVELPPGPYQRLGPV